MSSKTLPPMEFPPLDDYDSGWGFLDGPFFDPELLREAPYVVGGGALATVGYGLLTAYVKVGGVSWFDKPWKRIVGLAGVGLVGGRLAWDRQRDLARGMMGAVGGQLAVELIKMFGLNTSILAGSALGEDYYLSSAAIAELNNAAPAPQDRNLLADVDVQESRTLVGLDDVMVEDRRPELASWIS